MSWAYTSQNLAERLRTYQPAYQSLKQQQESGSGKGLLWSWFGGGSSSQQDDEHDTQPLSETPLGLYMYGGVGTGAMRSLCLAVLDPFSESSLVAVTDRLVMCIGCDSSEP